MSDLSATETLMADSALQSLRDAIEEKIANSGPKIRNNAIDHFADLEQKRRVDILVAAVTAHRELNADFHKINRADQVLYDGTGAIMHESYTKGRLNDITKLREKLTKLEAATNKVLADNAVSDDFNKLEQAIKGAKQKGNEPKPETEE
jgi:hypothetical protein